MDATVVCKSLGYAAALVAMGGAAYGPGTGQVCVHVCMVQYVAYLHLHGVCSVRSWRVYSVGCILTVASMDGGVTLSVMSSRKCICRTGFPIIPTPHPHTSSPHLISTPHPHTSSPHLISTPHLHTSSPHLIPTPHPHTSFPHFIPTPHPHTSSPHVRVFFDLFFIHLP